MTPDPTPTDVLAKAIELLGDAALAADWLSRPALALNGQRPADLLSSAEGAREVHDFLSRLEHGVYT